MTPTTEIALVTGERICVNGDAREVERAVLDAARGAIMEFAWLVESNTAGAIAVNPEHVVLVRALERETPPRS